MNALEGGKSEIMSKGYEVIKEGERYTIGKRLDDAFITNDGICNFYFWDTEHDAQRACEAYNEYEGCEWLGEHGNGNDRLEPDETDDMELYELYRLFDAIDFDDWIGEVYDDPDGTWEVTDVDGPHDSISIKCIDSKIEANIGNEYVVPVDEARYYLCEGGDIKD